MCKVFNILKRHGVDILLHNGDFEYAKSGQKWKAFLDKHADGIEVYGTSGNHEAMAWVVVGAQRHRLAAEAGRREILA